MNALVVGFSVEDTRRLSQELRAAGHHVLGAVGKQGAWTFLRAITPDVVYIPTGADGARAREWVLEVSPNATFQERDLGTPSVADAPTTMPGPPRPSSAGGPTPVVGAPRPEDRAASSAPTPEPKPGSAELQLGKPPNPRLPADHTPTEPLAPPPLPPPPSRKTPRPPDNDPQAREPHPDLVQKLAQVRFGDYHSILEVEPGGSPYALREKHDQLARRFSPRGWPGRLNPDEIDILDEISRGIADAYLILADPELAVRYERALAGARLASPPPEGLPR